MDIIVRSTGLIVRPEKQYIQRRTTGDVVCTKKESCTWGSPNNEGYLQVKVNGKMYKVHRLVAEAFIPNPDNLPEVNHIDGDKTNNNVTNLEWCDRSHNCQHAYDTGLNPNKGVNNSRTKLTPHQVTQIVRMVDTGISQRKVANIFGVTYQTVQAILTGRSWNWLTGRSHVSNNRF